MKMGRSGAVGEVLAEDPGSAVKTGLVEWEGAENNTF